MFFIYKFYFKNKYILVIYLLGSLCCGDDIVTMTSKNALAACHYGSYQNIDHTRTHLLQYADINKIPHTGDFREVYLEGPPQHSDPNKYITNIYLFLK
jgi:effector-binding domain-containing protein